VGGLRPRRAGGLDRAGRTRIAPHFDITPEILTHHRLALDLTDAQRLLPQSEHDWMADRTLDEADAIYGAALAILKDAASSPPGSPAGCIQRLARGLRQRHAPMLFAPARPAGDVLLIDGYFDGRQCGS